MTRIGIMQGRLVPPRDGRLQAFPLEWESEFSRAASAGLDSIEWIYDDESAASNPLCDDFGIKRMQSLENAHGISVESVCADFFMVHRLLDSNTDLSRKNIAHCEWLFGQCCLASIRRVILPFVDASALTTADDAERLVSVLQGLGPVARMCGLEVHLETSLAPSAFRLLLEAVPDVKVNYDSGNSAALGYDIWEELQAYGDRIGSVHIKDRVFGGGSVPLGCGAVRFDSLFDGLRRVGYRDAFILQVARGPSGDEVAWATGNRLFVEEHLRQRQWI